MEMPNARTASWRRLDLRFPLAAGPGRRETSALRERLPELLDAKALMAELGVTRAAAEAVMRQLPVVQFEGLRKVYVRRGDVRRLLEERTFTKDQVAA
jgi:hypothetical protein